MMQLFQLSLQHLFCLKLVTSEGRGKISFSASMMVSLEKANNDKTKSSSFDLKDVA